MDATGSHEIGIFRFRSMGTSVELISSDGGDAFARAGERVRETFEREDRRFSRFRADSELSMVNLHAGEPVRVSSAFAAVVALALEGAERTGGSFDPTLLDAVVAAGYDRDFDELLAGARVAVRPGRPGGRWTEIELRGRTLRTPDGVHVDLGGIAKGWTVDRAVERALDAGLGWALVNAGGDLRVGGRVPSALGIAVEDPEDPELEIWRLRVTDGALATTSVRKRAWGLGLHHVIDPATGMPVSGEVVQATVFAPTCAEAEVSSKAALLEGPSYLERDAAVLVMLDGRVLTNLDGRVLTNLALAEVAA